VTADPPASALARSQFVYFAYGSNMLTRRLLERAPSAVPIGSGYVTGRRLTFDKIGEDGSGKCDALATGRSRDRVYGVAFGLRAEDGIELDAIEGSGYRRDRAQVTMPHGVVEAMLYVAVRTDAGLEPFDWYRALTVAGAREHGLPSEWLDRLGRVPAIPDPDRVRSLRHEALLAGVR
jgi:hypothetical protein